MSRLWSRAVAAAMVIPVIVASQQWPNATTAAAASWMPDVQHAKSVPTVDANDGSGEKQTRAKFTPAAVTWPKAAEGTVELGSAKAASGLEVPNTPLRIWPASTKKAVVGQLKARMLDRDSSEELVGPGVVAVIDKPRSSATKVEMDYSAFASAAGAGYGSRLRLVSLPSCALLTPEKEECRTRTELSSVNDSKAQTLTATLESTSVASASSTVVLAAVAATSSDQGDFSATSLRPSSTWSTGGSSGEFTWSYPFRVPTVPGALTPSLAIAYSSGGTDGGVSSTNNQASWVGEGFELANSFVERKYQGCYDDRTDGNNESSIAVDLCWYSDSKKTNNQPWDNAFLSMDGHAGELVRDGNTANWRLEKDDGTRVAKIGTAASNNEYWRVTTPDGTQYFFGKGKANASAAGSTNSVWKVPVAANHSGEPGHATTFADSFDDRPWRWNLDYVISPTGNTVTYYYAKETNKYKKNLTTSTSYDRGGYLTKIQYGERVGAETVDDSPAKVTFSVEERCDTSVSSTCLTANPTTSTAKAWPDVPMDAVCTTAYCPDEKVSPTFFTRKRVKDISTWARNAAGTAWEAVDSWALGKSFPKPADGAATPSLWLSSITHTGKAGTAITLPSVSLTPIMLDSRGDGAGGVALEKPRLQSVTSESGALTTVEYHTEDCSPASHPDADAIPDNTTLCMPVWYSAGTASPTLQWFYKYVVASVTERDPIAAADVNLAGLGLDIAESKVTSYSYGGGGAWRYANSPMTKPKYRTWSDWRGYQKVTTVVGSGTTKNVQEDTYFRGMNGDRKTVDGGKKDVVVTDSTGTAWDDENWFAGMIRETRVLTAPGGSADTTTIKNPRAVTLFSDGRLTSRQIDVSQTRTSQALAGGGERVGVDKVLAWDSYGQPTQTESLGDTAIAGDETCTRTTYATPTDAATGPVDRVSETTTMPAACSVAVDINQVNAGSKHRYGTAALGSVAAPGLETELVSLTGSGTDRSWTTTARTTYDQWGRVTSATDTLGNTATTVFTHTAGGLLSAMATTTADPDGGGTATALTKTTVFDTRWGSPTKSVEAGGQTTEATLDALGRTTAVWNPGRAKASQTASTTYAYTVSKTSPSTVTTKTLLPSGSTYQTSISLLDSFMRTRQVQTQSAASGRIVVDTRYDSRGNAVLVDTYYNLDAPNTTLVQPSNREDILNSHRYDFDFGNRPVRDAFYSAEVLKWATLTAYKGDRVEVTPPSGGTPTTTVTDIQGRTTELVQHLGATPAAPGVSTTYSYDAFGNMTAMVDPKGNRWQYTFDLSGNQLSVDDPDKGLTQNKYNVANQLVESTDARGVTLKYFYDNLGRALRTTKADGTTVLTSMVWDTVKKGLITSASRLLDGGTVTHRVDSYDSAGRATSATDVIPTIAGLIPAQLAGSYTVTTSYNPDGSVKTRTLPATGPIPAETLTTAYTSLTGLPDTLTGSLGSTTATYVTDTQYLEWGTVAAVILGTHSRKGIMFSYGRDPATQQLTKVQLNRQVNSGVTDERTTLTYDPAGNIVQARAVEGTGQVDNQCFEYDAQQQLVEAWTPSGASCDAATRSQASLSGPAPYWSSWELGTTGKIVARTDRTASESSSRTFSYAGDGVGVDHPHFITSSTTSAGTANYAVDAAGNTVGRPASGGGQQTLSWDELGQLVGVEQGGDTVARMVYDANGGRLVRQESGSTTLYVADSEITVDGVGSVPGSAGGSSSVRAVRYYSHAGQTVAMRSGASNDSVTTLASDWQGTTHQQISNVSGALRTVWQDPYGSARGAVAAGWAGERGFVGGVRDATGLVRVGARDYDSGLGRFVTVDPVQDVADPLQWNAYAYANNSPITKSDPSGLKLVGGGGTDYSPFKETLLRLSGAGWRNPSGSSGSGGKSASPGKSAPVTKSAPVGNQGSQNPGGLPGASPVPDPQVSFWQTVGHIAVAVVAVVAVAAICAGTAGIGCLVMAGVAVGVAAGVADYAIDTVPTGSFDVGQAMQAGVIGGALGGLGGALGGPLAKGIGAAAKVATKTFGRTAGAGAQAATNSAGAVVDDWPILSGIVRDASKGKGNFGLGSGTASQARRAGESWVGEGYRVASDGKTLVSSDGLRTFRPPSWKPNLGKYQANFSFWIGERAGSPFGNGHLDITAMAS